MMLRPEVLQAPGSDHGAPDLDGAERISDVREQWSLPTRCPRA
jgi:hypothetical protein